MNKFSKWAVKPRAQRLHMHRRGFLPGQAMVEYVLIAALVAIAIIAAVTLTGPAVGNVFSNVVYTILDGKMTPVYTPYDENIIHDYETKIGNPNTPVYKATYSTNTPAAPTCSSNPLGRFGTPLGNAANATPTYVICD